MGNQNGSFNEEDYDSGIYNPSDLFSDSNLEEDLSKILDLSDKISYSSPLNSTPKKGVTIVKSDNTETIQSQRRRSLTKSKSIGIILKNKNRLDSIGLSSSEDDEIRPSLSPIISNFVYSSTWSPSSNLTNLNPSKSLSVDLNDKFNEESPGYSFYSIRKGMEYIGKMAKNLKGFYNDINSATLTGAIDVVVVEQEDGSFKCSPFHVRFGKLGVIRSKERVVDIEINGEPVSDLHMKLGDAGEAYFVEETESDDETSSNESIPNKLKISKTTSDIQSLEKIHDLTNISREELKSKMSEPIPIKSYHNNHHLDNEIKSLDDKIKVSNFFSDGEITPEMTSPQVSRPSTPKSDTELEITSVNKHKRNSINQENSSEWNWDWGQLPERQNSLSKKDIDQVKNDLIQNPKTKNLNEKLKTEKQNVNDGKYLNELEDVEMADLYINQKSINNNNNNNNTHKLTIQTNNPITRVSKVDDDQESGKGFSLPQSPKDYTSILGDIQLSLCGFMTNNLASPIPKSPSDLLNVSSGQQSISPSTSSTSLLAVSPSQSNMTKTFLELPDNEQNQFDDLFQQYLITWDKFVEDLPNIAQNPNLIIKLNGRYMNWSSASPIILSAIVFQRLLTNEQTNMVLEANMPKIPNKNAQSENRGSGRGWFFWPKAKTTQNINQPNVASISSKIDAKSTLLTQVTEKDEVKEIKDELIFDNDFEVKKRQMRKTTRLSSEQIKKLNLNPGLNEIKYSVTTALQGTTRIQSFIFLWNYDDKVIVSDIDGTITKSDVWGQVLPLFGKDWTQSGVADLFTAIERNEYKFMYLSARAIGQSQTTRNLLMNVNQNGFKLPYGPLLVTPTSLFTAFQKEVIERKPEEFKIQCLRDIQSLFSSFHNPFHAGYGNRTNDVTAYKTVGIDVSRIFTINPQGEVKHEVSRTFQSSYSKLCDFVDLIFPPYKLKLKAVLKPEFDDYNYWRSSLITDDLLIEMEMEIKKNAPQGKNKDSKEVKDAKKDSKKDAKKT